MEEIINKTVMFDYFSGRVSPLQKKSVENWLSERSNRELYYQWLHEWELSHLQVNTDWGAVYERTTQRINNAQHANEAIDAQPNSWKINRLGEWISRSRLLVASVVVVLLTSGWVFRDRLLYQTISTGFGETRSLTLPDGSGVTLNANSALRYPRWFGLPWFSSLIGLSEGILPTNADQPNPRTVELVGEADFSVRHMPDLQRFVVVTPKGLNVIVLGTQFTVFSRERGTRVALRSGSVQLTTTQKTTSPLIMRPGDLATLNRQGKLALTRMAHPEVMASWKNHRFEFEQTALREIADMLHENYGLTVTIDKPQLASRTISGSFTARSANELLQLVAQLLQINYIRENDKVSFTD